MLQQYEEYKGRSRANSIARLQIELMESIAEGRSDSVIQNLSESPSLLNCQYGESQLSPIMAAAFTGNQETFDYILSLEPDISLKTSHGDTIETVIEIAKNCARQEEQSDMLSNLETIEDTLTKYKESKKEKRKHDSGA